MELELIHTDSHESKNTSREHLLKFYQTFEDVRDRWFDGLIITGAPVEQMPFEQVEYWPELCRIMEWSRTHVHSTFHICWGAQAGLYYHYGIGKTDLPEKLFGVYPHVVERRSSMLMRGFDDVFMVPHSRHTSVRREDIERCGKLKILASSEQAGVYAMATEGGRQIFITRHSEYDARTLESEYLRDKNAGLPIHVPENYYPDDDDTKPPMVTWRSHANLLYQNWLNYFVYQTTPYDLARAGEEVTMRKATVNIYELELLEYDLPRIRIRVRCSKGTYIRSLAHEIGQALESGAHLTSLRRTRSGGFTLEKAFEFEEFLKKLEELETK